MGCCCRRRRRHRHRIFIALASISTNEIVHTNLLFVHLCNYLWLSPPHERADANIAVHKYHILVADRWVSVIPTSKQSMWVCVYRGNLWWKSCTSQLAFTVDSTYAIWFRFSFHCNFGFIYLFLGKFMYMGFWVLTHSLSTHLRCLFGQTLSVYTPPTWSTVHHITMFGGMLHMRGEHKCMHHGHDSWIR